MVLLLKWFEEWKNPFNISDEEYDIVMKEVERKAKMSESPRHQGLTVDERRNLSDSMKRHHRAMERLSKL